MVRLAKQSDIPELTRMGKRFHEISGYSKYAGYDEETIKTIFNQLIDYGTLITDGKGGMIGFLVFPFFFNKNKITAQELFWWVDEDKRKTGLGIELLLAAEERAKELGAKSIIMLNINCLDGDNIERLYLSLGYEKTEQTFVRSL